MTIGMSTFLAAVAVAVLVGGFALLNKYTGKGTPGSKDPPPPDSK
jgi:hypothetical protein